MIESEQHRFLEIAAEKKFLEGDRLATAKRLLEDPDRKKPVPFLLMEQGLLDGEALDAVLAEMLQRVEAIVSEGDKFARLKSMTRAILHYDQAVQASPSDERARWKKVNALLEKRRFDEAALQLTQLLDLSPEKAEILKKRGMVHARAGRLAEAVADLEASIALSPGDGQTHFELGLCHQSRREVAKAIASYERSIECDPEFVQAYNNLAIARIRAREPEKALEAWEKALQIDKGRRTILYNVQTLLKRLGRPPT